jgi:ABC-type transport system involved in multi-copper enzyme maturation permease subunit
MKPNAAQVIGLFITLFCGGSFIWLGVTALSWPLVAFAVMMMLAVLSVICFPAIPLKIAEAFVSVGLEVIFWIRDKFAGKK